ncbi:MAG: hypothetical protein GTN62_09355 [Gemmatimonadales bacterium]|nr:hypothetical protein [Gemmatimonadales bacterium]NIN11696.1 hypothetical protein [Gemmatimonadales bacterium]NIN50302.1 hypothetical protein [Gemmatimonadales bacterium]NIP07766.1 hypothetical protein [Gemmatimonadales bacterium]NIQ99169.1 hypothetical protein [Gemmatimonadales bacterium]
MKRTPRITRHGGSPVIDRRSFLSTAATCAAAVVLPELVQAGPYANLAQRRSAIRPVRVRGRVHASGRGVARVRVTDGLSVVDSAADGTFELVTTDDRAFISVSIPAGYRIPQNPTGTARFYRPLTRNSHGEMDAVFELEPLEHSDERHAFLFLADPQTENMQEVMWLHEQTVPDVLGTVASLGDIEVFGVAAGDIMYDNLGLFPEYERAVSRMGIPFFQVAGNHDVDQEAQIDEASTATFSRHFGPRYYSFDRGAVHYVVLDDVFWYGRDYLGYVDADQLTWLAADLGRVEPGGTVIVALHIPVLGTRHLRIGERQPRPSVAVTNRDALYRLLEPFSAHVLCGHTHESEHVFEHGIHEHVNGSVSGAWWTGPVCGDGTPSGYSVYEVRGQEVGWRYKSTGFGFEYQIRAYPRGANEAAPDETVANVWNWDPTWTVVWYEDGERKGEMARRLSRDPLSVSLLAGPRLPRRRPWVEPVPTNHLFYAPVSSTGQTITVEATDRFGRVYTTLVPSNIEPS